MASDTVDDPLGVPRHGDSACPDEAAWSRVRASGDADESFLAHVRSCPACLERLETLSAEWTQSGLLSDDGDATPVGNLLGRDAAAPQPVPEIPGLEDLSEVGRGGMGVVYRARDARLGRTVAVKVLTTAAAFSPEGRYRAEREARLLARVVDPHVVRVLSVTEAGGLPAIVMEWVDGESLAARSGPMPFREAVEIVNAVARAVAAIHAAGIVHRDIKPANVILARSATGGPPLPKLVDFGLARPEETSSHGVTRASVAVGTPSFMAPEQTGLAPGLGPVGPATDIHALGALLYWLLSGRAPYEDHTTLASLKRAALGEAPPLSSIVVRLPSDLRTIVATCLERSPRRRYVTAAAVADDLGRFLEGRPIRARRAGALSRTLGWARRRPLAATLSAVAAIATAASAGAVAHHVRSLERARAALAAKHDEAITAAALARQSFERLTDSTAERFLARGSALDAADRDHLHELRVRFRDWPLEPDAEAALHFRAGGLFRLANLFDALHWREDAVATGRDYRSCLDELERRGMQSPEEASRRYLFERMERAFLASSDRVDEAVAAAREAIARLDARVPADPALERHSAVALADLGNLEAMAGNHAAGRVVQSRAVATFDRLVTAAPDDGDLARLSLSVLYNAAINPAFGDDPAARRAFAAKLVDRSLAGLERFPQDAGEFGRGLLLGLGTLADFDLGEGLATDALAKADERAATARRLAAGSPHRQRFLDECAAAAGQRFRCLQAIGRPEEARAGLDEADAFATKALADEPAVIQRTWVLCDVLLAKAALEEACGRHTEAIAVYRRLLDAMLPWVSDEESPGPLPVSVAGVRAAIARLEAALGTGAAAESRGGGAGSPPAGPAGSTVLARRRTQAKPSTLAAMEKCRPVGRPCRKI